MKTKTYYHHKHGALKKASKPKKLNLSFKKAIPVAFIIFDSQVTSGIKPLYSLQAGGPQKPS